MKSENLLLCCFSGPNFPRQSAIFSPPSRVLGLHLHIISEVFFVLRRRDLTPLGLLVLILVGAQHRWVVSPTSTEYLELFASCSLIIQGCSEYCLSTNLCYSGSSLNWSYISFSDYHFSLSTKIDTPQELLITSSPWTIVTPQR